MDDQGSLKVKADAYGYAPKMFIDDSPKYRTSFGSFLSFILFGFIITACWVYGKDMHYRENPNSIFTQEGTMHPERYKIDKDKLNFSFGLQDAGYNHFMDSSIYNIKLYLMIMEKIINQNGEAESKYTTKDLKARPCTQDDFGVTQEYFQGLWLDKLFCPDNYDLTEIEGDFGADVWTSIVGEMIPCKNSTDSQTICQSQEVINQALEDNYWAYYTTDYTINPKNYTDPFEAVGRNVYGISSSQLFKVIDFNYQNIYIEDNIGFIFDEIDIKRGIQFTQEKELLKLSPQQDGTFLKFQIRFEKVRQTRIFRSYINFGQVVANVGGIMKVFMIGFMFISSYVASKFYYVNVVNSIFRFNYSSDKILSKKEQLKKHKQQLFFRKISQIFCHRFSPKHVKIQKEMLNYSVHKLAYQLDVKRILQKMIEIDKLKHLLLDEQQVKLFEYIPKPEINEQMLELQKLKNQKQKQKSQQFIQKSQQLQEKQSASTNYFLFEDHRTSEEKKLDAYQAFQYINTKQNQKATDKRILSTMDQNLKIQFQEQLQKCTELTQQPLKLDTNTNQSILKLNSKYKQQPDNSQNNDITFKQYDETINKFQDTENFKIEEEFNVELQCQELINQQSSQLKNTLMNSNISRQQILNLNNIQKSQNQNSPDKVVSDQSMSFVNKNFYDSNMSPQTSARFNLSQIMLPENKSKNTLRETVINSQSMQNSDQSNRNMLENDSIMIPQNSPRSKSKFNVQNNQSDQIQEIEDKEQIKINI